MEGGNKREQERKKVETLTAAKRKKALLCPRAQWEGTRVGGILRQRKRLKSDREMKNKEARNGVNARGSKSYQQREKMDWRGERNTERGN